jgi:hypothetical protein
MIWVTDANHAGGYRLLLTFNNGRKGIVDLHDKIFDDHRDIVLQLRDPEVFRSFRVQYDTVVWENGFDLAPEYLYDQLAPDAATPSPSEAGPPQRRTQG